MKKVLPRLRSLWSRFWWAISDYGIVWIILLLMLAIVIVAGLVATILGISIGVPALFLYLAWNWVIPVFGGPVIGYKTAIGLIILIAIVYNLLRR